MQVPLGGAHTLWQNDFITSFSAGYMPSSLGLHFSIKRVCGRPEGPKVGLEVGEKADFPGAESGCDCSGGRQLWISPQSWVTSDVS